MWTFADATSAIRSVPGDNRAEGPIPIGGGVIDVFPDRVEAEHDTYLGRPRTEDAETDGGQENNRLTRSSHATSRRSSSMPRSRSR